MGRNLLAFRSLFSTLCLKNNTIKSRISFRGVSSVQKVWTSTIESFGKFQANLENANISLDSNDPSLKSGVDKLTIECDRVDPNDLIIDEDPENKTVSLRYSAVMKDALLKVILPFQVDIGLSIQGSGNVRIGNIENTSLNVKTEHGDVSLENIKSESVMVNTIHGNIACNKTIRGNVDLKTENGKITTHRIQGSSLSLCSEHEINTGDLYAEELSVVSGDGNIRMKSIHGDCEIESGTGSIIIGSVEGRFNAMSDQSDIQAYLTNKIEHADISTNTGGISLLLSSDLGAQLDIETQNVEDSEAKHILQDTNEQSNGPCKRYLAQVNDGGSRLRVKAPSGKVNLKSSTWIEAISVFNKSS